MLAALMQLPNPLVLGAAFACMALVLVGGIIRTEASRIIGGALRMMGNAGLVASLGVTLLQLAAGFAGMGAGVAHASNIAADIDVSGNETRVAMADDGHFWVSATVNGDMQRFLIDTGATYTTISQQVADEAGVHPGAGQGILLHTANGDTPASFAEIEHMQVGDIAADGMKAVIAPDLGTTNVLGMNFLSGLGGWRVEGRTLVLSPRR